jgi:hypothetical protein
MVRGVGVGGDIHECKEGVEFDAEGTMGMVGDRKR